MQITIKRIDKDLPLPQYHTHGAAAFDFYSRETLTVEAKTIARIPSNFVIATPTGYFLMVAARSSLASKKGLMLANGVGIIDSDYCGENDEILISVYNFTDQSVVVERGERIAQGVFMKIEQGEWEDVEKMEGKNRGGFGSTGM
jgi:dUTP pyrophosphatase